MSHNTDYVKFNIAMLAGVCFYNILIEKELTEPDTAVVNKLLS